MGTTKHLVSFTIFGASLILLYSASTFYHYFQHHIVTCHERGQCNLALDMTVVIVSNRVLDTHVIFATSIAFLSLFYIYIFRTTSQPISTTQIHASPDIRKLFHKRDSPPSPPPRKGKFCSVRISTLPHNKSKGPSVIIPRMCVKQLSGSM